MTKSKHNVCLLPVSIYTNLQDVIRSLIGSSVWNRTLAPEFKSQPTHVWRMFHFSIHLVTFKLGGGSVCLAYQVH